MSSTIVLYIVAIVAVILIAYLVGIMIRRKNDGQIAGLVSKKDGLVQLSLAEEVETVRQMALAGHSLENFEVLAQKWELVATETLPNLASRLEEVQNYNDTFNFGKVKKELTSLDGELTDLSGLLEQLSEGLNTLKAQEDKNSARVKYALDMYEELQKGITTKSSSFGPALNEINRQLKNIQAEFSEFVRLNSSGDPVEAADILELAEEHTIALGQISEKIPELVTEVTDHLPEQLDDLETGYSKLLEENYNFGDQPIETRFQTIRESLTVTKEDLAHLDLDKAAKGIQDIQDRIDALYELFEKEIAAHKEVVKSIKIIPDYLKHVQTNHVTLREQVERLAQAYILPDSIHQAIKSLKKELDKMEEEILPAIVDEEVPEQPFSVLETVYGNAVTTLETIEQEQMDVVDSLNAVEKNEAEARQILDTYVNRLHITKRFMEKRNLPGIPQEFLNIFFATSSQLENLMAELGRTRIDIVTVEKLVASATKAMGMLEETAYHVVQYATLTEQLLQYSNRYRSFEPNVQTSFDNALYYFEHNYDYQASFEEISYALEIVEPGVTERFVNSYEKTRENIRF